MNKDDLQKLKDSELLSLIDEIKSVLLARLNEKEKEVEAMRKTLGIMASPQTTIAPAESEKTERARSIKAKSPHQKILEHLEKHGRTGQSDLGKPAGLAGDKNKPVLSSACAKLVNFKLINEFKNGTAKEYEINDAGKDVLAKYLSKGDKYYFSAGANGENVYYTAKSNS